MSDFVGLHAATPCKVTQNCTVIRGFQKMVRYNVSGLGVVDADGKLVDVLSERDLRGNKMNAVTFWALYSTVAAFKASVRAEYPQVPHHVITVRPTDTFEVHFP